MSTFTGELSEELTRSLGADPLAISTNPLDRSPTGSGRDCATATVVRRIKAAQDTCFRIGRGDNVGHSAANERHTGRKSRSRSDSSAFGVPGIVRHRRLHGRADGGALVCLAPSDRHQGSTGSVSANPKSASRLDADMSSSPHSASFAQASDTRHVWTVSPINTAQKLLQIVCLLRVFLNYLGEAN